MKSAPVTQHCFVRFGHEDRQLSLHTWTTLLLRVCLAFARVVSPFWFVSWLRVCARSSHEKLDLARFSVVKGALDAVTRHSILIVDLLFAISCHCEPLLNLTIKLAKNLSVLGGMGRTASAVRKMHPLSFVGHDLGTLLDRHLEQPLETFFTWKCDTGDITSWFRRGPFKAWRIN